MLNRRLITRHLLLFDTRDTCHLQALLRVGIVRSKRAPTKTHPYGYMKDKFVWSLVSAVGIFCLGAGVTCAHGVSSLMSPPPHLEHMGYSLAGARTAPCTCTALTSAGLPPLWCPTLVLRH